MPEGEGQHKTSPLPETAQQQNQQDAHTGIGRRQFLKGAGIAAALMATVGRKAFGGESKWFDTKDLDKFESANQGVKEFKKRNSQLWDEISIEASRGENGNIPLGEGFNEKIEQFSKGLQELRSTFGDSPHRSILDSQLNLYQ